MARYRRGEVGESRELVESRTSASAVVGQVIILIVAAVVLLMGGLALARAGTDDLSKTVVDVFGFTHTGWLGIVELAVGFLFLLGGLSPSTRDLGLGLGIIVLLAGIIVVIQPDAAPSELAVEKSYGWLLVVLGAAGIIGGFLPNGRVRRWRRVDGGYPT